MASNPTAINRDLAVSDLIADNVQKIWSHRYCTYGIALVRIGYGMSWLLLAITNHQDRSYLWGPQGAYSYDLFQQGSVFPYFSLFQLSDQALYFELIFHIGIIVTLLFMLGTLGRLGVVLQYIFVASLYHRNPIILDGGDNIALLVLFWLMLADSSAVALRPRRSDATRPTQRNSIATFLHNVAVTAVISQLSILYLLSGLYKAQGSTWFEGTALYYIFQVPEFSWPPLTDILRSSLTFGLVASYLTIFFQISMPALLLSRIGRFAFLAFAIPFHGSIALFMGLTSFASFMLATECVLIKDSEYDACRVGLLRIYGSMGRRTRRVFAKMG